MKSKITAFLLIGMVWLTLNGCAKKEVKTEEVDIDDLVDIEVSGSYPDIDVKITDKGRCPNVPSSDIEKLFKTEIIEVFLHDDEGNDYVFGSNEEKILDYYSVTVRPSKSAYDKMLEFGYELGDKKKVFTVDAFPKYIGEPSELTEKDIAWFDDEMKQFSDVWNGAIVDTSKSTISGDYLNASLNGSQEIASTFYGSRLNGVFITSIDKSELITRYINQNKKGKYALIKSYKNSPLDFYRVKDPVITSMFYVYEVTITVDTGNKAGIVQLSGIMVYWVQNPQINADGELSYDTLKRSGYYADFQGFIDKHITPNEEEYVLTEIK